MDPFIKDYKNDPIDTCEIYDMEQFNRKFIPHNKNKSFTLFHTNIRSIQKNFDQFQVYISQFSDFFCCLFLTETWKITEKNMYQIEGYNTIHTQQRLNQNDGVLAYVRKGLNYNYEFIKIGLINGISLTITLENKTKINIIAVYRPPSTNPYEFNENLNQFLTDYNFTMYEHVFFVGDINIDLNALNVEVTEDYLNLLSEKGYVSLINKETRPESGTCIDHIFVRSKSENYQNIISAVMKTNITDHFPIVLQYNNITQKNIKVNNKNSVEIKYFAEKKFLQLIKNEHWYDVYQCTDVEIGSDKFVKKIKQYINDATQTKKMPYIRKKKAWVTNGLVNSIKTRDRLFQNYIKNPLNQELKQDYINYRNKLNALIKKTKHDYFKNKIEKNKFDSKNLWNVVKEYSNTNKKDDDTDINKIILDNGEEVNDKIAIANHYNTFFSNVGKNFAAKIDHMTNNSQINHIQGRRISETIFLKPTDPTEIKALILNLKNKKAPGPDGITNEVLKASVEYTTQPLSYLINLALSTGKFPSNLKTATIKPLFKGGDKSKLTNYRPISLTSSIAKIFEKVLKNRLVSYLDKNNVISKNQFGFQQNKSTQDAIAKLTSIIYEAVDKKKACLGVFVDLAKAFDTVNHGLLLDKLEHLGVRGIAYNLFKSYLQNRTQRVQVNGVLSNIETVTCGVPQGTVLGPIMFIIYINDLLNINSSGTLISFADDTVIVYTADCWSEVINTTKTDLKVILDHFKINELTVNTKKTNILPFTSYEKYLPDCDNIALENIKIEFVSSIKYLGIYLDSFLRWDIHVQSVTNKLRGMIFKFYNFRNFLSVNHLKILYHNLVESILQYGIIGWGGIRKTYIIQLERIQKRILKIIYKKPLRYSSDLLYSESKLMDIRQLFCKVTLIFLHTNRQYTSSVTHAYETRGRVAANVFLPRAQKSIGQKCFVYIGPRIQNIIPNFLKNINSINLFKKKVKNWIISNDRHEIDLIIDSR